MTRLHGFTFASILAGAALACPLALAHATLKSAVPAAGAALATAPKEISLKFNEKLEESFSSVKIIDPAGKDLVVPKARIDASQPSVMKLALPALQAGRYKVRWTAVGHDGHRRQGDYQFTVN